MVHLYYSHISWEEHIYTGTVYTNLQ